jgi:hypothetical protein
MSKREETKIFVDKIKFCHFKKNLDGSDDKIHKAFIDFDLDGEKCRITIERNYSQICKAG